MEALRQRRARVVQAAHVPRAAAPTRARCHEPVGADEQPARRSTVHGARKPPERGRRVAHGRSDGTTSARGRNPGRARAVGIFERGLTPGTFAPLCEEAKTAPRRCPQHRGQLPRTVRPPQDRPACTSRASSCTGAQGAWVVGCGGTSRREGACRGAGIACARAESLGVDASGPWVEGRGRVVGPRPLGAHVGRVLRLSWGCSKVW